MTEFSGSWIGTQEVITPAMAIHGGGSGGINPTDTVLISTETI